MQITCKLREAGTIGGEFPWVCPNAFSWRLLKCKIDQQLKWSLAEGSKTYMSSSPNFSSKNPTKPAGAGKVSSPLRKFLLLSDFHLSTRLSKASSLSRNGRWQAIFLYIVIPSNNNSHPRGPSYLLQGLNSVYTQDCNKLCFLTNNYDKPKGLLLLS